MPPPGHADAGSSGNAGESARPEKVREWAWSGEPEVTHSQCPHQNTRAPARPTASTRTLRPPSMKTPAMAAIVLALASTPCLGESLVIEQGPHHQLLRQVMQTVGEDGSPLFATNHFTAVATGLGYLGDNGKWQASTSDFELIDGGAAAWKGQHRVTLAWN